MTFLSNMRSADKRLSPGRMVCSTAAIVLLGIALGLFSKYLDYRQGQLPAVLMFLDETFDLHNFLGRFAIWIFLAVGLSVYSNSPVRAAINVFAFFVGMVASYYWYSTFIAGFFPRSYAMIWAGFTVLSPLLAFICWYAKGNGWISLVLSSAICAVLFNLTFAYGLTYFDLRSVLELITFLCCLAMLRRRTVKDTAVMAVLAVAIAVVLHAFVPLYF